jgi:NAD(P)-dependent dehydrogenase (short-subunit alcohol dehydrogenase family)
VIVEPPEIGATHLSFKMTSIMKNVLITGANRGIGLAHLRAFVERGLHVFAAIRSQQGADELESLQGIHPKLITVLSYDAANPQAPSLLKQAIGATPIDLLLANAGAMGGGEQSLGSIDAEAALQLLSVNALAPLKLAEALVDNVAQSTGKLIAFQSSLMGSISENGSGGYYAYRISKAALNMVAKGLAIDLKARGITVVSLHPGWVKTRMGGASAPVTPEQSVRGQQKLFDQLKLNDTGQFFNYDGTRLNW